VQEVASLKKDQRTHSLKDQLIEYSDSSATNKEREAWIEWAFFLFGALFVAAMALAGIPFENGVPLYRSVFLETRPHTVTSYMVQRSMDGVIWADVMCQQQYCVFDSTAATAQAGGVITHRFPHREQARYLRLLPRRWLHMDQGTVGGNLRVGIMGSPEMGPELDFTVEVGGQANQAWLQIGCSRNGSTAGLWASKEDSIGKVQCCLKSPAVHVCTRDGCLTGSNDDEVRVNWHDARSMCESRGWRLCSQQELNRRSSSGCCGSSTAGTNLCGYDDKLVWTSTKGDSDRLEKTCRQHCHSEVTFDNVTQVTFDLLSPQWVDGLNVQIAVPEVPFHGLACFYWMWFISVQYGIQSAFVLYKLRLGMTTHRGSRAHNVGMYGSFGLVFLAGIIMIWADSSVPSVLSSNPVCKTQGPPIYSVFFQQCIYFAAVCFKFGVDFVCPGLGMYLLPTAAYLSHGSALFLFTFKNTNGWDSGLTELCRYTGIIFLAFMPIFHNTSRVFTTKKIKEQAHRKMLADIQKYEDAWEAAVCVNQQGDAPASAQIHPHSQLHNPETVTYLESIHKQCVEARAKIKEERDAAVAKLSVVNRSLVRISAGPRSWQHEFRYGRTGKYRQFTKDIDVLFDEAAMLNDHFLDLIDRLMIHASNGRGFVRGPVKRPDRALQKVIRKYYRDPRCLTDLVRCCIILPSICDVSSCLTAILDKSAVGLQEESKKDGTSEKIFKLVKVKDRFTAYQPYGYRDICLNVEVAWVS